MNTKLRWEDNIFYVAVRLRKHLHQVESILDKSPTAATFKRVDRAALAL